MQNLTYIPKKPKHKTVMYMVITIYAMLGTLSYYFLYIRRMGGVRYLIKMYGLSTDLKLLSSSQNATSLGSHLMVAALILWFAYYPRSVKGRVLFWMYFTLVSGVQILSGRIASNMLVFWLSLLIWYRYSTESGVKIKARTFVLAIILILGIGLMIYGYRDANRWGLDISDSIMRIFSISGFMEEFVAGANVPDIRILTQIIRDVPKNINFQYGRTFLFGVSVGDMLRDHWRGGHGGQLPPSFLGELYLNGGGWAIFLGMVLFGVFCGLLYKQMLSTNNVWYQFFYSVVVVQAAMLVKGEITSSLNVILLRIIPVLTGLFFWWFMCRLFVALAKGKISTGVVT